MKPTWRMKAVFELLFGVFIILFCIACEGFFSGTETAMVSIDRTRIKALAEKGSKKAALIDAVLEKPEKFFSTTLLGTNMVVVLSNAIATFMVIKYLGERYEYITILIMIPLILIFGEIVPKTVYRYHAEQMATHIIYPLKVISVIFYPFVATLSWLTSLFVKLFGLDSARFRPLTTKEDLENYLDMWNIDSSLKTAERKMVERIFDFSETAVEDIMVPLVNIKAVEVSDSIDKAVNLAKITGYSRIPVYSDEAYNIIGMVHAFDLLGVQGKTLGLRDLMRPARYAPNSIPINDLLKQLRTEGNSIAVVVNEYGGTIGIVTVEDILEEVVGEIYDEYDKEERRFVKIERNKYLVKARMEIDEINDHLKLGLPKEDYETVAGFLLKNMGRIPGIGESFQFGNIKFIIKQADKRSIKEVLINISDAAEETEDKTD
jgi:CBS domain containing-hemolysin-like protein